MRGGWKGVLRFRDPSRVIDLAGGRYPAVDSMTIDLTGAVANPNHKSAKVPDPVPTVKRLAVNHFTMVAEPMVNAGAEVNLKLTGRDVRFDLQHDKEGKPILMLTDAKEGSLHFDLTRADLEKLLLASAREQGGAHAVAVRSVDLDLKSLGPRAVKADLHVSTLVGFVPAGIRFTARVDIDDKMNAKLSHLTCDGDEILGPIVVGLIRPGLAKYEGKTKPLLAFPAGNLKLRDVEIRTGEQVQLEAKFGS